MEIANENMSARYEKIHSQFELPSQSANHRESHAIFCMSVGVVPICKDPWARDRMDGALICLIALFLCIWWANIFALCYLLLS